MQLVVLYKVFEKFSSNNFWFSLIAVQYTLFKARDNNFSSTLVTNVIPGIYSVHFLAMHTTEEENANRNFVSD